MNNDFYVFTALTHTLTASSQAPDSLVLDPPLTPAPVNTGSSNTFVSDAELMIVERFLCCLVSGLLLFVPCLLLSEWRGD